MGVVAVDQETVVEEENVDEMEAAVLVVETVELDTEEGTVAEVTAEERGVEEESVGCGI